MKKSHIKLQVDLLLLTHCLVSVDSFIELINENGLYTILLAKTAYRNYLKEILRERTLVECG